MRYIFTVLVTITFILRTGAQTVTIYGTVKNIETNEPLHYCTVSLLNRGVTTATDGNGKFRIAVPVQPTASVLIVSYTGYRTDTLHIAGAGREFMVLLKPLTGALNEVVITGVSRATLIRENPVAISNVSSKNIDIAIEPNIVDALVKNVPGLNAVKTGPNISKPFIRGLGYNRVLTLYDGIRQEGQQWGDEHGIEIDEYNVTKAEILKGPASLMYGSDALAGVMNIISILPVGEGTVKGNVFGIYQSNNKQRGLHADIGGNKNGFIWGAYGSYKAAADYKNKYDGYVFNSKFNEKDFGGYIGLNKQWGFSHLYISQFDQHLGLVEGDRDASGAFTKITGKDVNGNNITAPADSDDFTSTDPLIPSQRIQHFKLATDNSFNIGRDRLTVTLGYQRNQRQEFGNIEDPAEKELYFDLNTFNYNLQYHFAEKNNWKTTIGINGMQQSNKNKGVEALIPEYSLFDISSL